MKYGILFAVLAIFSLVVLFGCVGQTTHGTTQGIIQQAGVSYTFPKTDVQGKDLTDVPRYPGTVRMHYEEGDGEYFIDYYIDGDHLNDVENFYKTHMNGWKKGTESNEGGSVSVNIPGVGSYSTEKAFSVSYYKNDGNIEVDIDVSVIKVDGNEKTIISIDYFNYTTNSESHEVQSAAVPQGAENYDKMFKQALSSFGEPTLVSANKMGVSSIVSYDLKYYVKNKITSSKAIYNAINPVFASAGYTLKSSSGGTDSYDYVYIKGNQTNGVNIEVKGNTDSNTLLFTVTETQFR